MPNTLTEKVPKFTICSGIIWLISTIDWEPLI